MYINNECKPAFSVPEGELALSWELAGLKKKQVIIAQQLNTLLLKLRDADGKSSCTPGIELHRELTRLHTESRRNNIRCNEIYRLLQAITLKMTGAPIQ
jgi:hypothetical protein